MKTIYLQRTKLKPKKYVKEITYVTIIMSILSAMDIRKNGQLGFKQKVISATFQLLAHLCQMVPIAILALPRLDNPAEDGNKDVVGFPN